MHNDAVTVPFDSLLFCFCSCVMKYQRGKIYCHIFFVVIDDDVPFQIYGLSFIVFVLSLHHFLQVKMKAIICFAAIIAVAVAYPAQDGAAYSNEAIRQAQTSHLIPQNAQIQKVRNRLCNTN